MGHPEEAVLDGNVSVQRAGGYDGKGSRSRISSASFPIHSHTSQYGQLAGFQDVDTTEIRNFLKKSATTGIKGGAFAEEWDREQHENHLYVHWK